MRCTRVRASAGYSRRNDSRPHLVPQSCASCCRNVSSVIDPRGSCRAFASRTTASATSLCHLVGVSAMMTASRRREVARSSSESVRARSNDSASVRARATKGSRNVPGASSKAMVRVGSSGVIASRHARAQAYLATLGVSSEKELESLLLQEPLLDSSHCPWWARLARACREAITPGDPTRTIAFAEAPGTFLEPFVARARTDAESLLRARTDSDEDLATSRRRLAVIMADTPTRWHRLVAEAVVLEANARQLPLGSMTDETLRQQLAQLCGTRCGRLSFLREYPALARTLVQRMRFWAIACVEMLERLEADERLLTSWLQIEALTLLKATMEMGDDHAHGRSVALVELEGARVIYKPRSQRTIAALRVWAVQVSPDLPWGQFFPEVLDRGKYAWCAHVSNDPCNDKGGLERYYENFGHLLALTHVIGATDLHSENVIANGEWPVVVDGETLLQPKKRQARGVLEECGDHLMDQSPLAT